jgi:hypothetical protein
MLEDIGLGRAVEASGVDGVARRYQVGYRTAVGVGEAGNGFRTADSLAGSYSGTLTVTISPPTS